jgi:hypothetical protein
MTGLDIANQWLHNQHLAGNFLVKPEDVVRWLCAVQKFAVFLPAIPAI